MKPTIYLASASPRRHELLNQIGVAHQVLNVPAAPGEDEPRHQHESPLAYVQRTALEKAVRAHEYLDNLDRTHLTAHSTTQSAEHNQVEIIDVNATFAQNTAILAADTTVALDELVLGKPADTADAVRILRLLSDKTHTVHTAIVLSWKSQQWRALSTTTVTFTALSDDEINDYIHTGEPFGKAGAYGIQGYAAKFISRIEGSYSGVMGLPLYETANLLKHLSE